MTIGEKIRIGRNLRGYTQKHLGQMTGLGDVRIRQYELNIRTPKEALLKDIADALGMPIEFFAAHATDSNIDVLHLLFELEVLKGVTIDLNDEGLGISFHDSELNQYIAKWKAQRAAVVAGRISGEEYALWKARFPLCADEECR